MFRQNLPTLAAKSSAAQYTEAQQQEPSRIQVRLACQRCRTKRAKASHTISYKPPQLPQSNSEEEKYIHPDFGQCDGREPCSRCQRASVDCFYEKRQREVILDLLAEIEQLKKENAEKDKLLETICFSHDVETCKTVIQRLKDGNQSMQAVLQTTDSRHTNSGRPQAGNQQQASTMIGLVDLDIEPATCQYCSCRLRPWNFPHCSPSDMSRSAEATVTLSAPGLPTPASLPSLPTHGDDVQSQTDDWTKRGLARAYVRQLFAALLSWDYLPFCIVCEAPFLRAYDSGSSQFCSSALVNALLALAIRVIIETENETVPPTNCFGSSQFFDDAEAALAKGGQLSHLPDIQALGILSIYQISCGRETEAQMLAQLFFSSITGLCNQQSLAGEKDEQYILVRTTTYCGAVSLIRILRLVSGQLSPPSNFVLEEDSICLDQRPCSLMPAGECSTDLGSGIDAYSSTLSGIQLIGAKIFQLTEWVYKVLSTLKATPINVALSDVVSVYTKCLGWYDSFFALLKADGINTPPILFLHMYYQFCLLALLRPFIGRVPNDSPIRPSEICTQAVQSILSLAQSYESLFTLRRVSGFFPYFVLASGLFSRVLEDNGLPMDATYLRIGDDAAPRIRPDMCGSSHFSLHVKFSAGADVRLLLDKMKFRSSSGDSGGESTGRA